MRIPHGLLSVGVALVLGLEGMAQQAGDRKNFQAGDLRFALPAAWKVTESPASSGPGVIFTAEGGATGRFTVARVPNAGAKLDPASDPMTALETADFRIALQEAGLTPAAGALTVTQMAGNATESVAYRCKAPQGVDQQVFFCTIRTSKEVLRARLQIPDSSTVPFEILQGTLSLGGQQGVTFAKLPPATPSVTAGTTVLTSKPAATMPKAVAITGIEKAPAAGDVGRIVQESRGSLVFIEGGGSAGSGFVCKMNEGLFLLTNQHVLAGMNAPRFTRLDRTPINAGAGFAAVGHDLMRLGLQAEAAPLTAMYDIEKEAKIGDDIVVLGNSEGARVIQPLEGKLIGIGPDRIEVTAQFVPGNSGSPIVHVPTGKVIGIATYLIQGRFAELTDSKEKKVRRFGYRLDSAKQWQPLNWQAFQQDKATMDRVEGSTRDLVRLIKDMQADKWPSAADYTNSTLSRAVRDLDNLAGRQGVSQADRSRAFSGFFASVRAVTQADVLQARQTLRYDFFQRSLKDETQVREEMFKLFDRLVKAR